MSTARWGMPDGYDMAPKGKVNTYSIGGNSQEASVGNSISQTNPANELALHTANITVDALSKVTDKLEAENKQVKSLLVNTEEINKRLSASNTKLSEENYSLKEQIRKLQEAPVRVEPMYNTGGYVEASRPVPVMYPRDANEVTIRNTPSYSETYGKLKSEPVVKYETTYKEPLNPMTMFVEFLEELDILEEYTAILLKDGNSFENLCLQYSPSMYISEVCTDDDGEMLAGWDEADVLWDSIVEDDELDDKEAYIE